MHWKRIAIAAVGVACAWLALVVAASPTPAQEETAPPALTVTVVPASGVPGPRPTGTITVSADDHPLLTFPLAAGVDPLSSIASLLAADLEALGERITIAYSGDSNYEAGDGVVVMLPTSTVVTIVARPRDREPPVIEIVSPGDGVRYERGESVVAIYSCRDPGDRSAVTSCDGEVASGSALDTASPGTSTFTVHSADALGNTSSKTVTYTVARPARPSSPPATVDEAVAGSDDPLPLPGGPGDRPAPPPPPPPAAASTSGAATVRREPPARRARRSRPRPAPRAPATAPGPSPPAAGRERPQLTSYDPRSEPEKTVGIVVAAFTLLQFAGGGALTLSRAGSGAGAGAAGLDYEGVEVRFLGAASGLATGDRSRTWAWPGTATVDALAVALPARLARRSPLLARVLADGTWLRAIFGAASLLVPLAGVGLGIAAVRETGGEALPPVLALTIAIAALGVLDAAAGLAAVLTFALGVLVSGGIGSTADVRVMLALGALWFVVPVLAGAVRPLRRPPARGAGAAWDRLADIVIVSLVGAWAVQQIVLALPGLAGVRLPIAQHADAVALCVLAALAARTACETIAAHLYPKRLATTEPRDLPRPGAVQRLLAGAVRTAIFVVIAQTIVGSSWQLWVAAALFAVPQVLAVFEHLFPASRTLFRVLPRGLVAFVLMLLVATAGAALLIDALDERSDSFFADSFLLLALPGFVLALMRVFAREGEEPPVGWGKRVAGVAILAAGVVLALGVAF